MRWLALMAIAGVAVFTTQASEAAPLIVGNFSGVPAPGLATGPIATYDFSGGGLVHSFSPDGAATSTAGRGVTVVGNTVYYTEIGTSSSSVPTDFIRVAPFNGGLGGADTAHLPNPDPTHGVQDLAFANGALYAMTGYATPLSNALQVWKLDPVTGAPLGASVHITTQGTSNADGFTVLPNGNFLINDGDMSTTYREYSSVTGNPTGFSLVVPGGPVGTPPVRDSTGVDTDGTHLFFAAINSNGNPEFVETDLTGNFVASNLFSVANVGNELEDISLVLPGVPEPASLTLLGAGFGSLLIGRLVRRHRR